MKIRNLKGFLAAYEKTEYWWEPLDRPIQWACRTMAGHTNQEEVFGKIALVNRTYRTNLHLGASGAEWKLAGVYVDKRVDNILAPLARIKEFSRDSLPPVVEAHERLVRLSYAVTKRVQNSFCAKYLSFHFPHAVPIFDNKAYNTSWRLVGRQLPNNPYPENWNSDYIYHCQAILLLMDYLRQQGYKDPNLKLIDNVLYKSNK